MRGAVARLGWCVRRSIHIGVALGLLLAASSSSALEFWDERLQIHGFYEAQIRSIMRDFDTQDGWDLTQWYNVLNVEIEADLAPDGFGPFDLVSSFVRFDVRYDCVWNRACGLASSAAAFGDRAERLPHRVTSRRRGGLNGHVENQNPRRYSGIPRAFQGVRWVVNEGQGNGSRIDSDVFNVPGIDGFFGIVGLDGVLGTADDPANVAFGALLDDQNGGKCRYGFQRLRGANNGNTGRTLPWDPRCRIRSNGLNANQPNPFRGDVTIVRTAADALLTGLPVGAPVMRTVLQPGDMGDINTISLPTQPGFGELPFRPAPLNNFTMPANLSEARGIYLPSAATSRLLAGGKFDAFDQNFRQAELEWNRGASQQDEKELKEAYLDLEMFDSRLWLRVGKQQIVWGKTELFRTTDQFNPQDFALASLPSLEESRIALWALRGVWSFYDVGPFEDVRLEVAINYDQFEPADLGRCGEPYTPLPVCDKTFGLQAHSFAGLAIAGERRPPNPWNSWKGLEVGARMEWRWGRFSFALTDFYGFNDTPYTQTIYRYSRNVDPRTGRPRRLERTGSCDSNVFGGLRGIPGPAAADPDCLTAENALLEHHANQTSYALVCASSIGFSDLDRSVCAQSVFGSKVNAFTQVPAVNPATEPTVGALISNIVAGNPQAESIAVALAGPAILGRLVPLNQDPCDGLLSDCVTSAQGAGEIDEINTAFSTAPLSPPTLNNLLTQQQKALLGCGEFYGTNCELDGIDLMNTEPTALLQSWVGVEGTGIDTPYLGPDRDGVILGDTNATGLFPAAPQPGTVDFVPFRGPIATRFVDGVTVQLPGSRGPNDPNSALDDDGVAAALATGDNIWLYDPRIDGCTGTLTAAALPTAVADCAGATDLLHPFSGQRFANELAAAGFNAMMLTVIFSFANDDDGLCLIGEVGCVDDDMDPDTGIEFDVDEFDPRNPAVTAANGVDDDNDGVVDNPEEGDPDFIGPDRLIGCSFARPIQCSTMSAFWAVTGVQRETVNAGGNGRFGRRDFIWLGGKELVLRYEKRNVLGFSVDVAEDITKTNWSFEFTYIDGLQFTDNNELDGISIANTFNMTVSVDRPTFINFLNANRTFFFNSQWFFQYVDGYNRGFTSDGPWNMLATLTFFTGYFQDRLLPSNTFVYDFRSNSGAMLPSITYRFNEDFSATFGVAAFFGRQAPQPAPLVPTSMPDRAGRGANETYVENALSLVRERDEIFLRLRYNF